MDPWNHSVQFQLTIDKNIVLGPTTNINNQIKRINIELTYEDRGNGCYYLFTSENDLDSEFKHLYLKLFPTETILENISKSKIYSGSEYVILGLQIIYRLYNHVQNYRCKLVDCAFFVCDRKINLFKNKSQTIINKKEEIQNKIILLLKYGGTFYMPFKFDAYDKITSEKKTEEIQMIVSDLWKIKWEDIDTYMNIMIQIVLSNKYKENSLVRNYTRWYNYWININESWIFFKNKYQSLYPSPFLSFSGFKINECHEFINWLELYSFKYVNYNQFVFNNINNSIKEMAAIFLFKKLKNLINNVFWINNTITNQPLVSQYKK